MTNDFRTFDERVQLHERAVESKMIESHLRFPKPEKIKIDSQLYPPGSAFYHPASAKVLVLIQDRKLINHYAIVTLSDAAPLESFKGSFIRGIRDDGLLHHEIAPYVVDCTPIEHLVIKPII